MAVLQFMGIDPSLRRISRDRTTQPRELSNKRNTISKAGSHTPMRNRGSSQLKTPHHWDEQDNTGWGSAGSRCGAQPTREPEERDREPGRSRGRKRRAEKKNSSAWPVSRFSIGRRFTH
ncbi:unnamed protein product [Ectocarpus sp. 12 AP-2014]